MICRLTRRALRTLLLTGSRLCHAAGQQLNRWQWHLDGLPR